VGLGTARRVICKARGRLPGMAAARSFPPGGGRMVEIVLGRDWGNANQGPGSTIVAAAFARAGPRLVFRPVHRILHAGRKRTT